MKTRIAAAHVPQKLCSEIDRAEHLLEEAKRACDAARVGSSLAERRTAHVALDRAYARADTLLREAAAIAKAGPYRQWRPWRDRLSKLGTATQIHFFHEQDDIGVLSMGSIQVIDTGMGGPAIGEMQHGESRPAGAPASYGLDMELVLYGTPSVPAVPTAAQAEEDAVASVTELPTREQPTPHAA
jgi:hypothetical protein